MCQKPVSIHLLVVHLGFLLTTTYPVLAQTVGDPFIDTSDWVQSSSPIRDEGSVRGYITETIVRANSAPYLDRSSRDPYYNRGNYQAAIEFSRDSKIRPVVYENASSQAATSLEPPLRPTPDPVIQAANQAGTWAPTAAGQGSNTVRASYTTPVPVKPSPAGSATNLSVYPANPVYSANDSSVRAISTLNPANQNSYPSNVMRSHVATQFSTPAASSYSTLTNCCDPMYIQTQFVPPNVNGGPGMLRTYPQYGGNPYPNPGYSISQPYMRETWVPVIPLRSMPYGTYLGQGIIGQPVAYVDGEPVRNFLRYIFP